MVKNYQNGKIYKIVSYQNGDTYVGSTCEPILSRRLAQHQYSYTQFKKGMRSNVSSFRIIEAGECYIELVELYPCNSKDELHARERHWIHNIDCINKYRNVGLINELGAKEYFKQNYENNKDHYLQKANAYYETNKSKVLEKNKQKIMCECGMEYTLGHKSRHFKTAFHCANLN